jgi:hypothetical protein
MLLDIFAPFIAEWAESLPFGSLWLKWVEDAKAALRQLEENSQNEQSRSKQSRTPTASNSNNSFKLASPQPPGASGLKAIAPKLVITT